VAAHALEEKREAERGALAAGELQLLADLRDVIVGDAGAALEGVRGLPDLLRLRGREVAVLEILAQRPEKSRPSGSTSSGAMLARRGIDRTRKRRAQRHSWDRSRVPPLIAPRGVGATPT
jgi:hypothetical protein